MKLFLLFLALVSWPSLVSGLLGLGRLQSIAVTGKLTCNGQPAKDVKIKLYEKEKIKDIKLDEMYTDASGSFHVSGSKTEITNIDPKVNIYHRCDRTAPCYRKLGITIPDQYITSGGVPRKTYDIGTLNLGNIYYGETVDCIN
ncbi:unnamed protein product [Caenorhabditis angaria]|uniref:Uncharacterized protein n=1 Tax=Caenorhabditis angaria TaxID=860376 RepID=A0A9P1IYC6_9PELO|nr:unnamed protein product [Caenorhabditis angaria]